MNKNDPWDNVQTVGILLTVAGFGLYVVTPAVLVVGMFLLAVCTIVHIRRNGFNFSWQDFLWDFVPFCGALAVFTGVILTVFRYPAGAYVLIAGGIVEILGISFTFRRAIKDPFRCPECGAVLSASGTRIRTGGLLAKRRDTITCVSCGAMVDLLELYEKMKRRRRW